MRDESKPAVKTAIKAGIQVVMITGDAKDTNLDLTGNYIITRLNI